MRIIIRDQERGILFKNGNYKGVLQPGKHYVVPFSQSTIEILDITKPFYITGHDLDIFLKDTELCKDLTIVDVFDKQIAIHYIDGKFQQVIGTGKYAFWNILKKHTFTMVDTSSPEIAKEIDRELLGRTEFRSYAGIYDIESHMKGVLFFNNTMQRILEPGRYYFWLGLV